MTTTMDPPKAKARVHAAPPPPPTPIQRLTDEQLSARLKDIGDPRTALEKTNDEWIDRRAKLEAHVRAEHRAISDLFDRRQRLQSDASRLTAERDAIKKELWLRSEARKQAEAKAIEDKAIADKRAERRAKEAAPA